MAAKKVLIIEDERPLSHALELKLQHEGCQTAVAHNGKDGLELFAKDTYDVVLLDMMMPEMDGFQVLEHMKASGKMPTVFVLSNLSLHDDEKRVIGMGAKKYFIKSNTPLAIIVEEIKNA